MGGGGILVQNFIKNCICAPIKLHRTAEKTRFGRLGLDIMPSLDKEPL